MKEYSVYIDALKKNFDVKRMCIRKKFKWSLWYTIKSAFTDVTFVKVRKLCTLLDQKYGISLFYQKIFYSISYRRNIRKSFNKYRKFSFKTANFFFSKNFNFLLFGIGLLHKLSRKIFVLRLFKMGTSQKEFFRLEHRSAIQFLAVESTNHWQKCDVYGGACFNKKKNLCKELNYLKKVEIVFKMKTDPACPQWWEYLKWWIQLMHSFWSVVVGFHHKNAKLHDAVRAVKSLSQFCLETAVTSS